MFTTVNRSADVDSELSGHGKRKIIPHKLSCMSIITTKAFCKPPPKNKKLILNPSQVLSFQDMNQHAGLTRKRI